MGSHVKTDASITQTSHADDVMLFSHTTLSHYCGTTTNGNKARWVTQLPFIEWLLFIGRPAACIMTQITLKQWRKRSGWLLILLSLSSVHVYS